MYTDVHRCLYRCIQLLSIRVQLLSAVKNHMVMILSYVIFHIVAKSDGLLVFHALYEQFRSNAGCDRDHTISMKKGDDADPFSRNGLPSFCRDISWLCICCMLAFFMNMHMQWHEEITLQHIRFLERSSSPPFKIKSICFMRSAKLSIMES